MQVKTVFTLLRRIRFKGNDLSFQTIQVTGISVFFSNRIKFAAIKSSPDFVVSTNSHRDQLFIPQMLTRNRRYFNFTPRVLSLPWDRGGRDDDNLEFCLLSKTSTVGLGFRFWPVTGS